MAARIHVHGIKVQLLEASKESPIHLKHSLAHDEDTGKNIQTVLTITDWTGHLHFNQQEISVCNQEAQFISRPGGI